ncbi:putative activator of 90kDa heat shock protein ATPase [Helianthus anomalus]
MFGKEGSSPSIKYSNFSGPSSPTSRTFLSQHRSPHLSPFPSLNFDTILHSHQTPLPHTFTLHPNRFQDYQVLFGFGGKGVDISLKMENAESTTTSSYTYWVREAKQDAAPLPVPKKLTADDLSVGSNASSNHLGSAWNKAGTWEEKNLNKWATERIKELVLSVGSLEFSSGKAEIAEVTRCTGDAFLVTVRNKKRVGYTYEITLKVKGEWLVGGEKKKFNGNLDLAEFSFGELDDLQVEVRLNEAKDLLHEDKQRIREDMKKFLKPICQKLLEFEAELKER